MKVVQLLYLSLSLIVGSFSFGWALDNYEIDVCNLSFHAKGNYFFFFLPNFYPSSKCLGFARAVQMGQSEM